jgi:hypothetical protein
MSAPNVLIEAVEELRRMMAGLVTTSQRDALRLAIQTLVREREESERPGEKTAGQLHKERYGEPGPNEGDGQDPDLMGQRAAEEPELTHYVVCWQIDVDAASPRAAAKAALGIQRDLGSIAHVFDVTGPLGDTHTIDLDEKEEPVTLEEVIDYLANERENASGRSFARWASIRALLKMSCSQKRVAALSRGIAEMAALIERIA